MKATARRPLIINILPEEYRPRHLNRRELLLVLVFVVGIVALTSQAPRLATEISKTREMDTEYRYFVSTNNALAPSIEKTKRLKEEVAALQAKKDKTESLRVAVPNLEIKWDTLTRVALVSPPAGIQPTSISKDEQGPLEIEGFSNRDFDAIRRYYDQLSAVPGVTSVSIIKTEIVDTKGQAPYVSFIFDVALTKQ